MQSGAAAVAAGLHRPDRDPEQSGELLDRQPEYVDCPDDVALVVGQHGEHAARARRAI